MAPVLHQTASRLSRVGAGMVFDAAGVHRKSRRRIKVKNVRLGFGVHTWALQEYNPILTQNRIFIRRKRGTV